ncbi:hypothetical protein RB5267 [Rhodopirellula baltica SH 1]|uniref:Uncharacterized protein n=1 Tax=Rhodopirellula baltica (strain DSM 10527 / NCIMB 13988 / SH1) TaxID=243090 RepID=Q7UGE6_RHOBA|nr:hypothetical protein RB5267 [Rhodopirellula baltica SH 1]
MCEVHPTRPALSRYAGMVGFQLVSRLGVSPGFAWEPWRTPNGSHTR